MRKIRKHLLIVANGCWNQATISHGWPLGCKSCITGACVCCLFFSSFVRLFAQQCFGVGFVCFRPYKAIHLPLSPRESLSQRGFRRPFLGAIICASSCTVSRKHHRTHTHTHTQRPAGILSLTELNLHDSSFFLFIKMSFKCQCQKKTLACSWSSSICSCRTFLFLCVCHSIVG